MRMTPAAAIAVIVSLLLLLLTWLLMSGLNLNSARYDRELRALSDFSRLERGLNREVLTARVGLSRNYDALVQMTVAYSGALDRLREAAGPRSEESAGIEVLAAKASRQLDFIEQFKTKNALLQNSFAYFGMFSARLAASDNRPVVASASALAAAVLRLSLDSSQVTAAEVQYRLNELANLQNAPGDADSIRALIAHGGLLHALLPATDGLLRSLIAAASIRDQDVVHSLIVKRQLAARASAREFRLLLYATSLVLLGVLAYCGMQLRSRAMALRRRAAFEHVIASISTRFINSRADEIATDVVGALQKLAECIGADRAYFVVAAEPVQVFQWCRDVAQFRRGWPQRALDVAMRFDRGKDGVIHIPRIKPSHSYDNMNLLVEAGMRDWFCIPRTRGKKVDAVLCFDAQRAGTLTQWTEFALFRMAFDAIANAVSRVALEQEKARLEARLQQARRMETIGTFASGIAHNFNNIVGAILGYTEMADTRARSGAQTTGNLAEIRHAGERARELVNQILTFGRRDDGRREPVCVRALIAETVSLLAASTPSHVELLVHEPWEEAVVSGQPAQLQQVIINVCNNAAQAMDQPGIIEINAELQELQQRSRIGNGEIGPGRFVMLSVTDPGRGMDGATLERLFEPFFTTRPEGNGLGLATAHEIVRAHDGTMKVRSAPGAGTRFEIWLPCISFNEPVPLQHSPGIVGRGVGETVLVFEADRARLLRHEEILAALGYEPVGFTAPAEATSACRAEPARFDAALICQQPGTTLALDFATALHGITANLPIILVTSSASELDAPLLAASGISELVRQPLMSAELAAALSRCLAATVAPQLLS
jgi:signal transduction histidine kinase/CheY-like chemotaxis protein